MIPTAGLQLESLAGNLIMIPTAGLQLHAGIDALAVSRNTKATRVVTRLANPCTAQVTAHTANRREAYLLASR